MHTWKRFGKNTNPTTANQYRNTWGQEKKLRNESTSNTKSEHHDEQVSGSDDGDRVTSPMPTVVSKTHPPLSTAVATKPIDLER